ncbi:MAG: hypothetical protein LBS24_01825 [Clostridiales Family XIII bacterium]|jgi:hypothetical protein|nr:hypothetical protein [Clostridiales Family XIII bacterium]
MSEKKTAITERLKNVLLVVLVFSAILLLYFLWSDDPGAALRVPGARDGSGDAIPVETVLRPEKITVNFGAENYTVPVETASLWYGAEGNDAPAFMRGLARFLASDNIAVSAINKQDFTDVMRARSIRADFSFAIPMMDFCEEFDLRRPAQLDIIDAFTCAAYSEASPESLFLCNQPEDRYYRLAAEGEADFKELIAFVETGDNVSYYPLKTFSGVENDTMMPLGANDAPTALLYARNIDPNDADDAERITGTTRDFFGKSFDFTRKITEGDGTIVYMYGYGEKVLVINRDGSFEYSAAESDRSGATGFFDALTTALAFVASHKEPSEREAAPKQIFLKDARTVFADGRRTYSFSFGLKLNGHTLYYAASEPLLVDVAGSQVSYYKRDMIDGFLREPAEAAPAAAYAPFDILTEHFAYICETLSEKGLIEPFENSPDDERMFEAAAEMVTNLSSGLLRPANEASYRGRDAQGAPAAGQSLLPVWVLTVQGVDFYFDLYTGAPAGYRE